MTKRHTLIFIACLGTGLAIASVSPFLACRLFNRFAITGLTPVVSCAAWFLILTSFCGFLYDVMFIGRQETRTHNYSTGEIYTVVLMALLGDVIGLSLIAAILKRPAVFSTIGAFIVAWHFFTRHWTTERRHTPHFGQRANTGREKQIETIMGHLCDALQVALLAMGLYLTGHPIWLYGIAIFVFAYVMAVRTPHTIYPDPYTYGAGLLLLTSMPMLTLIGIISGTVLPLKEVYIGIFVTGVLSSTFKVLLGGGRNTFGAMIRTTTDAERYLPAMAAVVIAFASFVVGLLLAAGKTPTKLDLANASLWGPLSRRSVLECLVFFVFISSMLNTLLTAFYPEYKRTVVLFVSAILGRKGISNMEGQE